MKEIMLKIVGTQVTADLEEDHLELITEGKLYEKGGALYLEYEESELSGVPGCQTRLKLEDDTIKLKRVGGQVGLDTEIQFQKGKRYTGYYDTPYGAIEMEVLTNSLESNLTKEGTGSIAIDYHISLKGLAEGRNRLNIQLM